VVDAMKIAYLLVLCSVAATGFAAPQTKPISLYRKWLNEDVTYIITPGERAAFKRLNTDAERKDFIEQFWLRRDPTPGTGENEFKDEHYRRIAYANEHFGSQIPGWKTDRGRIYIVFGPPDEIEDHSSSINWTYHYMDGIGTNVKVQFVDSTGVGEFHMIIDPNHPLGNGN
jgi:GWxTD domain-containing protein